MLLAPRPWLKVILRGNILNSWLKIFLKGYNILLLNNGIVTSGDDRHVCDIFQFTFKILVAFKQIF